MVRIPLLKSATILFDRIRIQVIFTEILQNTSVHRTCQVRICKHAVHFLTRTMIIPIKVTTISSGIRVKTAIYRSQASVNSWNIEKQEIGILKFYGMYVIFFQ